MMLATDLDRTLLWNGKQKYDGSMPIFREVVRQNELTLVFVTGRHLKLVKQAIKKYSTPKPDYIVGDVGTTVYKGYKRDREWDKLVYKKTRNWNVEVFKRELKGLPMKLQEKEKQNPFKLSYYAGREMAKECKKRIGRICKDAQIIYSVDETKNEGLLDILPKAATKLAAIEYIRKKLGKKKSEVIYSGDSGNDILPLTYGYKGILVRNAIREVRSEVMEKAKRIYCAKGTDKLNGYYVSGIVEGLNHYGIH